MPSHTPKERLKKAVGSRHKSRVSKIKTIVRAGQKDAKKLMKKKR